MLGEGALALGAVIDYGVPFRTLHAIPLCRLLRTPVQNTTTPSILST